MKFIVFAMAAVALASASPVAAQPVDPAAVTAARELLIATNFNSQLEQGAHQSAEATFNTLVEQNSEKIGTMSPELRGAMLETIREHTSIVISEMQKTALDEAARIYARHFTADELRQLRQLQTHPVMAKAQRVAPTLVTELSQIGIRAAAGRQDELRTKLEAVLERHR